MKTDLFKAEFSHPTVSVILNCLNCSKYIREAIDSVYAQTYKDLEIIFWDNASIDKSAEIAKTYDKKLRYFKSENTVPLGKARNWAMEKARGKYIAFLDCDDIWLPKKLEKQIPLFEKNKNVGLVFCDSIFFNKDGDKFSLYKTGREVPYRGKVFRELLRTYFLSMETVVLRKEALDSLDHWFDDRLTMAEEMDLFLRLSYKWELDYVDEPLAKWRMHAESESNKKSHLIPEEKRIILQKLDSLYADFEKNYASEIQMQNEMIDYHWALSKWKNKEAETARLFLRPYILRNKKAFIAFFFSLIMSYEYYNSFKNKFLKWKYGV